ncbi:MAG: dehypoxanthine futalosine cyclase [Salinivirgaceae bacterium]|nr:MAG: dehypoxanthine futalosine cyclase [Salinivirgaceae bacterium]
MQISTEIQDKIAQGASLTKHEAIELYRNAPLTELMMLAHEQRMQKNDRKHVGWIIDRNVNITNGCFSQCTFCNFCVKPGSENEYITSLEQYREKIDTLFELGGDQLLLQGGMHPKLGLAFYTKLFSDLKNAYPKLKLHALGPAEVHFLAKKAKLSISETLKELTAAGMDSLPGAGAEILVDRVRNIVSPAKCTADEWLNVMREAHQLGMVTSATMMFGHVETVEERIEHLLRLREVQAEKPEEAPGFVTFIPWPFMSEGTKLLDKFPNIEPVFSEEYLRMIAISRLVLDNIPNLQASLLTVGEEIAKLCLFAGANDLGSIMIEENVVSSAGVERIIEKNTITDTIRAAGFIPRLRNQAYEFVE